MSTIIDFAYRKKIKNNCIIIDDTISVPIYNCKKEIIKYALIDKDDFDKVMLVALSIKKCKTDYEIVTATPKNRKIIPLSHYIFKKPKDDDHVIDHKNNDSFDNRKCNLHEITKPQNSQNKKKTTKNTSSDYIGVFFDKTSNKWLSRCGGKHLGRFEKEIDAATIYDKYSYIKYGEFASNNKLVTYKEICHLTLEDIKPSKEAKTLPDNIYIERKKYYAEIVYKKKGINHDLKIISMML